MMLLSGLEVMGDDTEHVVSCLGGSFCKAIETRIVDGEGGSLRKLFCETDISRPVGARCPR